MESFMEDKILMNIKKTRHAACSCKLIRQDIGFYGVKYEYNVISNKEQKLNFRLENQNAKVVVVVTLFYAKCSQTEKLMSWESLGKTATIIKQLWMVDGDFNVIRSVEEKLG